MTTTTMFSPPRREKARADDHLPKGGCGYIMLHPEVKGLRCACVGFALNQSIPGSTCDCGHQACYHTPEMATASVERHELETLKKKLDVLERELDRNRQGGRAEVIERLGRLEELVDRTKGENETELKSVYRSIGGLWQNIETLNKRAPLHEDRIEGLVDEIHLVRARLIEVDDAAMRVEDRVDYLESTSQTPFSRRRKASTPPSPTEFTEVSGSGSVKSEDTEVPSPNRKHRFSMHMVSIHPDEASLRHIQSFRERTESVGSAGSQSWTVHVSLLPTSSQPFPFEKDTAAYKRCLSRGLHQMIVVPDTDSASFKAAVNEAFDAILRGRQWRPLVARLCDVETLRGLPMLRQMEHHLIGCEYDASFLQHNCTVNDASGKMLDLYIAMSEDTISWPELKYVPQFTPKLEASWTYDPFLDGPCLDTGVIAVDGQDSESNRAAGDLAPAWPQNMKRNASEISRASSFGAATDEERSRAKIRRACTGAGVDLIGRILEAV